MKTLPGALTIASVADVDFTDSNTFSGLGGCEQSNVPDANNGCDTGPC